MTKRILFLMVVAAVAFAGTATAKHLITGREIASHTLGERVLSKSVLAKLNRASTASVPPVVPKDGKNGTDGQSIVGPSGKDGASIVGPKGENSTVPGPRGEKGDPAVQVGAYACDGTFIFSVPNQTTHTCPGVPGPQGAASTIAGPVGPQGPKGDASSVVGPQGAIGPQGPKGDKGDTGAPGPSTFQAPQRAEFTPEFASDPGQVSTVSADCPEGTSVTGGGFILLSQNGSLPGDAIVMQSASSAGQNGWTVKAKSNSVAMKVTAVAYCV